MNRLDKLVIALLFVVLAVMVVGRQAPLDDPMIGRRPIPPSAEISPPPGPPPKPPRIRRPIPVEPSPTDPVFAVESPDELPKGASGTAFPINGRGAWMTAQHVTYECAQVGLLAAGGRNVLLARVAYAHPAADVAIITANRSAPPVAFSDAPLSEGQAAYSLGYPRGEVGAAYLQLLGRSRTKAGGRMPFASPTLTWAEVDRFPRDLDTLGGMSGGPVVDEAGQVVGVLVAGSMRRGRALSIAPELLQQVRRDFAPADGAEPRPIDAVRLGPRRLAQIAESAVRDQRVAKVYCRRT
ncbi:MAG TPA: serine protease [Alphaproteobacteria bacterium]